MTCATFREQYDLELFVLIALFTARWIRQRSLSVVFLFSSFSQCTKPFQIPPSVDNSLLGKEILIYSRFWRVYRCYSLLPLLHIDVEAPFLLLLCQICTRTVTCSHILLKNRNLKLIFFVVFCTLIWHSSFRVKLTIYLLGMFNYCLR